MSIGPEPDAAAPERRLRIDIYHHFPEGLPLTVAGNLELDVAALVGPLTVTVVEPTPPPARATRAILIVTDSHGGTNMPGQITVDTTTEVASLAWVDDHGDTDAAAPSNASGAAVVTFTSDNPAVLTIDPASGQVTAVAEGTANVGATIAYPDGSAVLEADGVTPFPPIDSVAVTVSAGAAVGATLSLSV